MGERRFMVDTTFGQLVKQPVQRLLGEMGWELQRRDASGTGEFLVRLLDQLDVTCVLDVGANVGQFATRLRLSGYQGQIFSVEPGEKAFARLQRAVNGDPSWLCANFAAGSESTRVQLNVSTNSTSSSLLSLSERHVSAAPESITSSFDEVRVERIDTMVAEWRLSGPFLLKLDVQGYEVQALKGAIDILAATPIVSVELSFDELFEGGAGYLEVLSSLDAAGYRPIAIEPGFRDATSGELLQCDITMIRK